MDAKTLNRMYRNMVCDTPKGVGFYIDRMPDFFDHDVQDNCCPHVHTFYEIIWFREAGGIHTVDFHDYEVQANSLFFLSPGQVHHFDRTTRHKGLLLKFCTDFLRGDNADGDLFIKFGMFDAVVATPYCTIDPSVVPVLDSLVEQMRVECERDGEFGHVEMLRSLVKMFLVNVRRHSTRLDALPLLESKPTHRLFVHFRRLLEENYRQLHSVGQYAELMHVSTKTLSNGVMECSGKSALSFINDRIMLEAKRLMRFSNLMVKEIAYHLGYDDPSYFVKFFKRQTGHLPSTFRELEVDSSDEDLHE